MDESRPVREDGGSHATHPPERTQSMDHPRVVLALDDTQTLLSGPHVQGAGIHHNPIPGPTGSAFLYDQLWVVLPARPRLRIRDLVALDAHADRSEIKGWYIGCVGWQATGRQARGSTAIQLLPWPMRHPRITKPTARHARRGANPPVPVGGDRLRVGGPSRLRVGGHLTIVVPPGGGRYTPVIFLRRRGVHRPDSAREADGAGRAVGPARRPVRRPPRAEALTSPPPAKSRTPASGLECGRPCVPDDRRG